MDNFLNFEKIVGYIDGTYDLFHYGHVNILRQAHEHCDFLIVGVATDVLCREKKKLITVMTHKEREAVVRACVYADAVVEHTSLAAADLIRAQKELDLPIRVHLVGEDYGCWGPEQSLRLDWCRSNGIETIRLRRTPGISTTEIKQRLLKRAHKSDSDQPQPYSAR